MHINFFVYLIFLYIIILNFLLNTNILYKEVFNEIELSYFIYFNIASMKINKSIREIVKIEKILKIHSMILLLLDILKIKYYI